MVMLRSGAEVSAPKPDFPCGDRFFGRIYPVEKKDVVAIGPVFIATKKNGMNCAEKVRFGLGSFEGEEEVKASLGWLSSTGAEFIPTWGTTGYAHLTHYTVEYCERGEGSPLVLIPGLAGGFGLLGPLATVLSRHFRVISYQLRGEGDCFALRRPFELSDLSNDLAELVDLLCLEKPTIMGVSFGGILGLDFASRFPHRLGNLVIQGVGARFERGLLQRVAGAVLSRFPLPPDSPFINQFFNVLFGRAQHQNPLFQFVTRQCWQTDQSVMAHRFHLAENFNMASRLGRIRVPTLILAGDRDILVSNRSLNDLCAGISNSLLVRLPNCGHLAFVTEPAQVGNEVHRFVPA